MSKETYTFYCVEAEDGTRDYTDDVMSTVNGFIHRGLDCDVFEINYDKPLEECSDEELCDMEVMFFMESYHA